MIDPIRFNDPMTKLTGELNKVIEAVNKVGNFKGDVNLKDFGAVGDGFTDDTKAFKEALDYCKANYKNLFIGDGVYVITEPLVFDSSFYGFTLQGNSTSACIRAKLDTTAINIKAHNFILKNISVDAYNGYGQKFTGVHFEGARGYVDNLCVWDADIGIKFGTECWCTNAVNLNITGVNKGVVFGNGSGGGYVQFIILDGTAGYDNTHPNGSVGITFEYGAGWSVIGDGGQLSSFHYGFDLQDRDDGIKIGKIYIEHILESFTPTSKVENLTVLDMHDVTVDYVNENVNKITHNGYNKSSLRNRATDSAIPVSKLRGYFLFDRANLEYDYSGYGSTLDLSGLKIVDGKEGLFGPTKGLSASYGSSGYVKLKNMSSNKFSIVFSFKLPELDWNTRVFSISSPRGDQIFIIPGYGITLLKYDSSISENSTLKVLDFPPVFGDHFNNFVYVSFDFLEGTLEIGTPEQPVQRVKDEILKNFTEPINDFNFMLSYVAEFDSVYTFNYLMVFDDHLNFSQAMNIYRQTSPIVTPRVLRRLIDSTPGEPEVEEPVEPEEPVIIEPEPDIPSEPVPLDTVRAYFVPGETSETLVDLSGNGSIISTEEYITLESGAVGKFGPTMKFISPGDSSFAYTNVNNISGDKATFVISYRVSEFDLNTRVMQITSPSGDLLFSISGYSSNIMKYDTTQEAIKTIYTSEVITGTGEEDNYVSLSFDFSEGTMLVYNGKQSYTVSDPVIKRFNAESFSDMYNLLRYTPDPSSEFVINYIMVLNECLTVGQSKTIYDSIKPFDIPQ